MILPVSATKDHCPHMSLDAVTVPGMTMAEGAAEEVAVMPLIPYGFNAHRKDLAGVIRTRPETLIACVTTACVTTACVDDDTRSRAHHGVSAAYLRSMRALPLFWRKDHH